MNQLERRFKAHMQIEQCESIAELKLLCRYLIERDIAYKAVLHKAGLSVDLPPPG